MNWFANLLLFNFLLTGLNYTAFAAKKKSKEITVKQETTEIGIHKITGKSISANTHIFSERIHSFQYDSSKNDISVSTRGLSRNKKWLDSKGDFLWYDLASSAIEWSKELNYNSHRITCNDGLIVHSIGSKTYLLNDSTGERTLEINNRIIYTDKRHHIALAYQKPVTIHSEKDILSGINIKTGKKLWERVVPREFGWNGVHNLNDSNILILSDGMHSINLFTGKGWDKAISTGKKDYTRAAVTNGLGVAAGLLTGTFVTSGGADILTGLVSNVIIDSTLIYWAGKESLICVSFEGETIWRTPLEEKITSASWIIQRGKQLYLINKGSAKLGYREVPFGEAYLASFDLESGTQNYLVKPSFEKKQKINTFHADDSLIVLASSDRLNSYNLAKGERLNNLMSNNTSTTNFSFFVSGSLYLKEDSTFAELSNLETDSIFLFDSNGNLIILNNDLDRLNVHDSKTVFFKSHETDKFTLLQNSENVMIAIDSNSNTIVDFKVGRQSVVSGDKLFTAVENSLMEIDLNQFNSN